MYESFLWVPISFDGVSVPLDFLENSGNPVDVIIGCPTLETLQSKLDLGEQHVTVTIRELYVVAELQHDEIRAQLLGHSTDSDELTSGDEAEGSSERDIDTDDDDFIIVALKDDAYEPREEMCGSA